jgi:ribonuclease R
MTKPKSPGQERPKAKKKTTNQPPANPRQAKKKLKYQPAKAPAAPLQKAAQLILDLVNAHPKRKFNHRDFYRQFEAKDLAARTTLDQLLADLARRGLLAKAGPQAYQANPAAAQGETLLGRVDYVNPEFCYVLPEPVPGADETKPQGDIWVARRHAGSALDGDLVRVAVHRFKRDSRREGEIVEVLQRARTEFVGVIDLNPRYAFVVPDKRKMHHDIFIRLRDVNGAKQGQKVVAEITEWDEQGKNPVGRVKKVLGKAGEHETEMHSIMAEYELPYEFPEAVVQEAEAIPEAIPAGEAAQRRDFRGVPTFTIDPDNAQDFDDALSLRKLDNGLWEVGVHIADVTHYVRPDTLLEREAYHRATSVYLVDRCVPMLPEKLSNRLCSLRPHEDKLTFSAVFQMTDQGKIEHAWFGRTAIRSVRRFTYEEAQTVLETGQGDFAQELLWLNQTAKIFQQKRIKAGAILFETTEVKFKLDENKKPIELVPKVRQDAHKLIEEFMLLANKGVAEFVHHLRKGKTINTMVYRTHAHPDPERVQNFANFARQFGYNLKVDEQSIAKSLNHLAQATEGKPEQGVLQQLAIRAMAKAKYTTEPLGHFGLAFAHYSHFTSPIRRYPDMLAHRLLQHYLDGGAPADPVIYEERCKHSSDMEKRAADAERASVKYKQVELMQDLAKAGKLRNQALPGVITGITEWGMYVEITATRCEGMARLSDLKMDYYELDDKKYQVTGRRYGRTFRLGDPVRVYVKATNLEKRTIDLLLDEEEE